jgi:hypothetical protein
MKDLIRSPLQFVRPMTDNEWQDLVTRAGHRERRRVKRHQPHAEAQSHELTEKLRGSRTVAGGIPRETGGRGRGDQLTRSASSGL